MAPSVTLDLPMRPEMGGGDLCVGQIDACRFNRRFPVFDIGFDVFQFGFGIIEVLLTDRIFGQQFLVTRDARYKCRQCCLGAAQAGFGIAKGSLERRGVYLIKNIAGLHVGTFGKQSFLDQPVYPGDGSRRCERRMYGRAVPWSA